MSPTFKRLLEALAELLVLAAKQTATPTDDLIASFILNMLKDPERAASQIAVYNAATEAMATAATQSQNRS